MGKAAKMVAMEVKFFLTELPLDLKLLHLIVLDLANNKCLTYIWSKDFEVQVKNI